MKKMIIVLTCLMLMSIYGRTQFNTVEKIRSYYNKINLKISNTLKDKESEYCNEVMVNKLKGSWAGVGNYQKRIGLWYSTNPVSADTDSPEYYLDKVNTNSESAADKTTEEYLFWNGELLFYCMFVSYNDNGIAQQEEHRLYFNKGKLLKYDLKKGSRDVSDETQHDMPVEALRHGNMMKQLFLNSCEYAKEEIH